MTFAATVVHIVRKDLRQARLPILVYLVTLVVVSATVSATLGDSLPGLLRSLMVVLAAMFGTIAFIHADAPGGKDAYWITTPTSERAMFWAKISGLFIAIVAPAVVAQWTVLVMHGMPFPGALTSVAGSVVQLLRLLSVVAVVAAVTPHFQASAVWVVLYIVVLFLPVNVFPQHQSGLEQASTAAGSQWILRLLIPLVIASLYLLYTRRWSVGQSRMFALASVIGVTILPRPLLSLMTGALVRDTTTPASVRDVPVTADLVKGAIVLHFALPAPNSAHRIVLVNSRTVLELRDGQRITLLYRSSGSTSTVNSHGVLVQRHEIIPVTDAGLQYRNAKEGRDSLYVSLLYGLPDSLQSDNPVRNASIDFVTAVELQRRETVANLPVLPGLPPHDVSLTEARVTRVQDSLPRLRLWAHTLNGTNVVLLPIQSMDQQLSAQRADSARYSVFPMLRTYTHTLISRDGRDTVSMQPERLYDSVSVLPIMFGQVHKARVDLVPLQNDAAAALLQHPAGLKLLISGWRYESFFQMRGNVRLP